MRRERDIAPHAYGSLRDQIWTRGGLARGARGAPLQPAAVAEVAERRGQDGHHYADDDPEGVDRALARHAHVHAPDRGDQREGEQDYAECGEHAQDVVQAVRDHRLVRVLERLHHFLVVLEHVPDPLRRVDDVVEVDLEVVRHVALLRPLEVAQHRAARPDDLAEVDDLLLDVGDVADDLLRASFEDVVLEAVELVAHLAEHREAVVERVVDDLVEQVARPVAEQVLTRLLGAAAALEEVLDRLQWDVREGDQVVGPDEDVQLARVEPADRLVEHREVKDDEEVLLVGVDLRPLVARADVLVVERVEVEVLLEPGELERTGALDVDPAQAAVLDDLDARLSGCLSGVTVDGGARCASQPWLGKVRHGYV